MTINNANHLFILVKRFVRHRERMMIAYGAHKTPDRLEAIGRLLDLLNHYCNADPATKCKVIYNHMYLLSSISAGKESRYYRSDHAKLMAFSEFAQSKISEEKSGVA